MNKTQKTTWLVIANAIKAEIYAIDNVQWHTLVTILENPDGRLKSQDLTSDKAGSSDAHREEHQHFAKEIGNFLDHHEKQAQYQALIICAEAGFHGLLNAILPSHVKLLITRSINKDYIPLPANGRDALIKKIMHEV
jgi:protein required for attachment to host cells